MFFECTDPSNEATCPISRFCIDASLRYTDTPDWMDIDMLVLHWSRRLLPLEERGERMELARAMLLGLGTAGVLGRAHAHLRRALPVEEEMEGHKEVVAQVGVKRLL